MIEKKDITEEMQNDRAFIIAAVSCDLIGLIKEKHEDWLDSGGYQPYYDLVVELTDYMLFDENSYYLEFMKLKEKDEKLCFNSFSSNCFDWYHMTLARQLVTEELLHEVCFGNPKEYFAGVEKAKKNAKLSAEVKEEKQMVKQVIPPAQVEIIQRALNVLELALNEQCNLYHDDNIAHVTFDIITLRGILKGEVSVVWPKEDTEGFSFKHSVDWPDYGDEFPLEEL
jgi:hypothetical protein